MKKILFSSLLITIMLTLCMTVSAFADKRDFLFENKSNKIVEAFYISPADADDWKDNIFGKAVAMPDSVINVRCPRKEKAPLWDIRLVLKSGREIRIDNVDIVKMSKLVLTKTVELQTIY